MILDFLGLKRQVPQKYFVETMTPEKINSFNRNFISALPRVKRTTVIDTYNKGVTRSIALSMEGDCTSKKFTVMSFMCSPELYPSVCESYFNPYEHLVNTKAKVSSFNFLKDKNIVYVVDILPNYELELLSEINVKESTVDLAPWVVAYEFTKPNKNSPYNILKNNRN